MKGPFKDINDFFSQAKEADRDVRIYSVEGHSTKIVVPEQYAQQLDEVRNLRLKANQPNASLDALSAKGLRQVQSSVENASVPPHPTSTIGKQALEIVQAQIALRNHPLGNADAGGFHSYSRRFAQSRVD